MYVSAWPVAIVHYSEVHMQIIKPFEIEILREVIDQAETWKGIYEDPSSREEYEKFISSAREVLKKVKKLNSEARAHNKAHK